MILNTLILFGIIQVVYRPMQYILRIPQDLITQAVELANSSLGMNLMASHYTVQNTIINVVKETPEAFASIFSAEQIAAISSFNFQFFGLDLSRVPYIGLDSTVFTADNLLLMVIPILSGVTMILSQIIMTKMSGQDAQGQNQMKIMMWVMSALFVYIGFTIPVGFSLYYTVSNVLVFGQSLILKKIYDPEEMKRQVQEELAAKRAEKKKKKQVKVVAADGAEEVKEVSEAELARIRLARARELEAQRYQDE